MQKIIHGRARDAQTRAFAKVLTTALEAAMLQREAKSHYDTTRDDAVAAIKEQFPTFARGDVLILGNGRVEGADVIERKLDEHAFACTVDKRYDSPSEAIAKLIEQGVLKLDLAEARKVLGAVLVSETRKPGSPKFVPASVEQEQEQEQKEAVNQ